MFQIEIEIDADDHDQFDTHFLQFCADRLAFQPEPSMQIRAFNIGRSERRTINFHTFEDAAAYRRRWSLFEDARITWDEKPPRSAGFGLIS